MQRIFDILKAYGAADVASLKFTDCEIINNKLIDRLGFEPQSVIIATVPYYTEFCDQTSTVSTYALAHDYHLLFKEIEEASYDKIKETLPGYSFKFFGDHSPINEKAAAAKAGLGIIGKNQLLITPNYASFVFLLEIITDMNTDAIAKEINTCIGCGKCISACPSYLRGEGECLSSITQKKGELTDKERNLIISYGSVWGCDICQRVCPYTEKALAEKTIYSSLEWFSSNVILVPTEETINNTDDFRSRAYGWRGKNTILRNINILNGNKQ
jgi:epoxyqueuosine reductase QueG